MRSLFNDMNNDPSSSRNFDPDSMDDLVEELNESEEPSFNLYGDEFRSSSSPSFPPTFDEDDEDEEDFSSQEFSALNQQLDQLQSALDLLESRNADIHSELLQLLQSNREVRRCITEELASEGSGTVSEGNNSSAETSGEPENTSEDPGVKVTPVDLKLEKCSLNP